MICRLSAGMGQSANDGFNYATYHGLSWQPDGSFITYILAHCRWSAAYTHDSLVAIPDNLTHDKHSKETIHATCYIFNNCTHTASPPTSSQSSPHSV